MVEASCRGTARRAGTDRAAGLNKPGLLTAEPLHRYQDSGPISLLRGHTVAGRLVCHAPENTPQADIGTDLGLYRLGHLFLMSTTPGRGCHVMCCLLRFSLGLFRASA